MKKLFTGLLVFGLTLVIASIACRTENTCRIENKSERLALGQEWANKYLNKILNGEESGVVPAFGFVPDKETAISIAVSVWTPIYGKEKIGSESPYFAYLVGDYWVVTGSLPENTAGGTATAVISKKDGKIIHVIHYK